MFTLVDLRKWLADKLGRESTEELPEGVHITFARQDPIRVRCDDNHLELILNIAEIRDARRRWTTLKSGRRTGQSLMT